MIELEWGVTVYPARAVGDRWRAVWYENGQRRQCQAVSEDRLAARLDKVTERLATGALNLASWGVFPKVTMLAAGREIPMRAGRSRTGALRGYR